MRKIQNSNNDETQQLYIADVMKRALPCPFCGARPQAHHHVDAFDENCYYIQCTKCYLVFNNTWGTYETNNLESEVEKWNQRHVS